MCRSALPQHGHGTRLKHRKWVNKSTGVKHRYDTHPLAPPSCRLPTQPHYGVLLLCALKRMVAGWTRGNPGEVAYRLCLFQRKTRCNSTVQCEMSSGDFVYLKLAQTGEKIKRLMGTTEDWIIRGVCQVKNVCSTSEWGYNGKECWNSYIKTDDCGIFIG